MEGFVKLFGKTRSVVFGMVHLKALPGCPKHQQTVDQITKVACQEARIYQDLNMDAVIVENMHDVPYQHTHSVGPEVTASMAVICQAVKSQFSGPVGVQVLAGANKQAMAVAKASGLDFIRAEGFVFSHVADEGLINACAGNLLRYRKTIGADNVKIFTDIKKKHSSHALTADISITETAKAAEFFLSDGVILTGSATGKEADPQEVIDVGNEVNIPVLVGSGINDQNLGHYILANGLIVGSHFKKDGLWQNDLDVRRLERFMSELEKHRTKMRW